MLLPLDKGIFIYLVLLMLSHFRERDTDRYANACVFTSCHRSYLQMKSRFLQFSTIKSAIMHVS